MGTDERADEEGDDRGEAMGPFEVKKRWTISRLFAGQANGVVDGKIGGMHAY